MLRLDKMLCDMNIGTRSQVRVLLKQGQIQVNGETVIKPEYKVDEKNDRITCKGERLQYQKYAYYMLYKPAGVVSATQDNTCRTVTELLKKENYRDLFPVGRLDKDTEGLLLMTNDGELAHRLLSPKKHVSKVYEVHMREELSKEAAKQLEEGVDIGEDRLTLPAKVEFLTGQIIRLTITEGKFHQVKRMLKAVGNEVIYLKRVSMGSLVLDENLKKGSYRELTQDELYNLMK